VDTYGQNARTTAALSRGLVNTKSNLHNEKRGVYEQQTELANKPIFAASSHSWSLFCLGIVVLKFLLVALDPLPKLYLGDSFSYIWTAVSGWMPEQRSFLYGYVIRWSSIWTGSLTSLLILQVFLGIVIAIMVAWICRAIFNLPKAISYLFGLFCSIDPLQLAWERYVMTETCSLFFYVFVLQQSFIYLRDRRIANLLAVQLLSVLTIGFRMSFLIVVQFMAVALPVIAFFAPTGPAETAAVPRWQFRFLWRVIFWRHLAASIITMFLLDQGYQHVNGILSHGEPAHIRASGYFLLAIWAPALQPQDADDPRLADIIAHGNEFGLRNILARNWQMFAPDGLVHRWDRAEPDAGKSNKIATRTALNAFKRDPAAVVGLATTTYLSFWTGWDGHFMRKIAKTDLRQYPTLRDSELKLLAKRFHLASRADLGSEPQTLTKWYYVAASPYFFLVLLSPVLSFALLFIARDKANTLLLFAHTTVLLTSTFLLSLYPVPRFLHPLSLLTLLCLALAVKSLLEWRSAASQPTPF
jgi:hypothetical protein